MLRTIAKLSLALASLLFLDALANSLGKPKNSQNKSQPKSDKPSISEQQTLIARPEGGKQPNAIHAQQHDELPIRPFSRLKINSIAFFTFILTIVTALQVWAFITSERAFVSISDISIGTSPILANDPIQFTVRIQNGGKSTAIIKALLTHIYWGELPEIPQYKTTEKPLRSGPVIAGGFTTFRLGGKFNEPKVIFSQEQAANINGGTLKLYVYGTISYSDDYWVLGDRRTGFCVQYNPARKGETTFNGCQSEKYVFVR